MLRLTGFQSNLDLLGKARRRNIVEVTHGTRTRDLPNRRTSTNQLCQSLLLWTKLAWNYLFLCRYKRQVHVKQNFGHMIQIDVCQLTQTRFEIVLFLACTTLLFPGQNKVLFVSLQINIVVVVVVIPHTKARKRHKTEVIRSASPTTLCLLPVVWVYSVVLNLLYLI